MGQIFNKKITFVGVMRCYSSSKHYVVNEWIGSQTNKILEHLEKKAFCHMKHNIIIHADFSDASLDAASLHSCQPFSISWNHSIF
jgi:hypothetical protein